MPSSHADGSTRAYDAIADDYADLIRGTEPEQPAELGMIAQFAVLVRASNDAARVLDAGCGAGRMLPVIAGYGCDVTGVDFSAGMLRRARTDYPGFPLHQGDLTALPFDKATLDGYLSWYSTVHLDDAALAAAFDEAARVLRPAGIALVGFQEGSEVRDVGPNLRQYGHDVELLRWHRSVAEVAEALERSGFAPMASLSRGPLGDEVDGQAAIIARRG